MIKMKITNYILRGAMQLSRKYRMIGVPPELAENETCYLDRLKKFAPLKNLMNG